MYHRAMTTAQHAELDATVPEGGRPLGPDSLTWRLFGDRRMALLGPRAAVLQNMLPSLGQGVQDHSVWFEETIARLERSIPPIYKTLYGPDGHRVGHEVRDYHRDIKGTLPDGTRYSALNPQTYYWAHACFVEHMITAADTFIRPLGDAERDQIIGESLTWFERYGVSARGIPRTWPEFEAYFRRILEEELIAHRTATYGVGYATKGWPRPKRIPRPVWALVRRPLNAISSSLTIGGMPPRGREILGLPWDATRERRYQRFAAICRRLDPVYRRLPAHWRMHPIPAGAFAREGAGS